MSTTQLKTDSQPITDDVTTAVIKAISNATGKDMTEISPLYNVIDPDALNRLFAPTSTGHERSTGTAQFELANCKIKITGHSTVTATPLNESPAEP